MNYIDYYKDEQIFFHANKDIPPFCHEYGMHAHEIYELFYLISGDGFLVIEGTSYPLTANSVYIIRSNEAHYAKLTNLVPYERIILHFYPDILSFADPEHSLLIPFENRQLGSRNYYPLGANSQFIIEHAFENILKQRDFSRYHKRITIISSLFTILAELQNLYQNNPAEITYPVKNSMATDIILYINRHLFEDISIDALCGHFFISRSRLNAIFKESTSTTIWKYIMIKRLVAAKTMLQSGMRAQEAASACGYKDYSSFFRAYKEYYGTSPSGRLSE